MAIAAQAQPVSQPATAAAAVAAGEIASLVVVAATVRPLGGSN